MNKTCIVINRQYASGGREIAHILSERLSIPFYDGRLLQMAAEEYGLSHGVLKDYDEKKMGSLLYSVAVSAGVGSNQQMLPYAIFQAQSETIRRLADAGPCILIGRCADYVLRDHCKFLNVFIYATSMDARVKRAVEVDGIAEKDAISYITKKDRQRKEHYNFHTDKQWGKMTEYDLCLNSSAIGYEACADAIIEALKGIQ
ncbi:MAG: cytidylate kinase-like family protein [Clostridia bacterium]|nr:cytidylate kinase-like family protein [Clostridia bacterium]